MAVVPLHVDTVVEQGGVRRRRLLDEPEGAVEGARTGVVRADVEPDTADPGAGQRVLEEVAQQLEAIGTA